MSLATDAERWPLAWGGADGIYMGYWNRLVGVDRAPYTMACTFPLGTRTQHIGDDICNLRTPHIVLGHASRSCEWQRQSLQACLASIIIRSVTSPPSLLEVPTSKALWLVRRPQKPQRVPWSSLLWNPRYLPPVHACMRVGGGTFEQPTYPPEPLTTCEANGVFADRDLRTSQTSLLPPLTAHHENLGHMIVS